MTAPEPQPGETAAAPRRLHIKTYGCQMNVYDSERMADVLRPLGYAMAERPEDADLVVLNTCHIREKAAEKVYSELGRLKEIRGERLEAGRARSTIVVAGCVAQAQGAEIMARQPAVDLVVGPQSYHQLPELIARTTRARGERLAADFAPEAKFDALPVERKASGVTAFLTVQEGCDKFCSFCVVPYTRGAEWSRPAAAVMGEARSLARQGVREVTLLGQNVNAYAGDGGAGGAWSLARLIRELAAIDGLERIRFTTSHPNDMADDLVAAFAEVPQLMPYLHLPVQSGSDRVLRAMNRRHTAAHYLALVERLRAARPDLALTSDFIVGFPGESDADFAATLKLAEAVGYAGSFTFKYSRRPGTPASALPAQVDEAVKAERLAALNALIDRDRKRFDLAQLGRTLPVLWERPGRRAGQLIGRSPYLQAVWADAPAEWIGRITPVEMIEAGPNSLQGRSAAMATVDHAA
ncbi:MAG: tRNA (N6-isopentenyl adenosine(37)-C2)-methylthiotransferase MiaB [Caulobacteraceae bacterium]|nr:tRNA (N6-isopentenyl adenosine(37)-C2)-methylthiotransferase MiaB [Caulobacter sp.]